MAEPWSRVYCLDWQNINLLAKNDIFSEEIDTLCTKSVSHQVNNFESFIDDRFCADKLNDVDSKPGLFSLS